MEGYYDEDSPRRQKIGGKRQSPLFPFQLSVDRDPDGLKASGGGVDPPVAIGGGNGLGDHRSEKRRASYRGISPGFADRPGDPPGIAFLTVCINQVSQLIFGKPVDNIGRGILQAGESLISKLSSEEKLKPLPEPRY